MSERDLLKNLVDAKMKSDRLSLRKAGDQAGVAHTTIQRVLDEETIDLTTVEKICDWLGIPASAVLNVESPNITMAEDVSTLFALDDEFAKVFSNIAQKIKLGALDKEILTEITAFADFRLHEHLENRSK